MINNKLGDKLIIEILSSPKEFVKQGKGYYLINEYFDGYPIDTLIPLLTSKNSDIQHEAIYILSELGEYACNHLIEYIIPLIYSEDTGTVFFAMECLLLGTFNANHWKFYHLFLKLLSDDMLLKISAMSLISIANNLQLKLGLQKLENEAIDKKNIEHHRKGISYLLKTNKISEEIVYELINSKQDLLQYYGAICSKKIYEKKPFLLKQLLLNSTPVIKKFANDSLELLE